jgi:hypothetical protein
MSSNVADLLHVVAALAAQTQLQVRGWNVLSFQKFLNRFGVNAV